MVASSVLAGVALPACGGQQENEAADIVRGLCQDGGDAPQTGFSFQAADGMRLVGVIRGEGRAGIVLAHGYRGSLCEELELAEDLARRGYTVLAYDARAAGASEVPADLNAFYRFTADVKGAAGELRRRGIRTVILVGDSLGGTAVVAAAPYVEPPPVGVVSIGGPATMSNWGEDLDALGRATKLSVPLLYLVSEHDPYVSVDEARTLVERAPSADKRLIVYPGEYHAVGGLFFEAPYRETAYRTFLAFLASRAAGRPFWVP
jgi:alpha-beta hydrolase superfamily lysophospholipase